MQKVAFYTLGCKLNFSETSTISSMFEEKGYKKVDFQDIPDIIIINTCSVTENADKKCRKIIRDAKKISPNSYVIIIGCFAQLRPKEISKIEGVDAVLGASEKFKLLEHLDGFIKEKETKILASEISCANTFNNAYSIVDRTRTFLKVQDGCNYGCAFCTIPLARGKSRSESIENIIISAKDIAQKGGKEVVLTGVNIGDYGIRDGKRKERFADLITALDKIEGIERFRISSIEPNLITKEIIKFVSKSRKFVPHFHIPLQSGSNKILKLMNRRYLRELYADRVETIKAIMPNCCIGVDVIVGFPEETHEDFLETYNFLNELDISYLHVFSYSERPNTKAAKMEGMVPVKERKKRSKMLRILSDKKKIFFYKQNIGKTFKVLLENDVKGDMMYGFTENYLRVSIPYDSNLVNQIRTVRVTDLNENIIMKAKLIEKEVLI